MTKSPAVDEARCPLCGGANRCGMAEGKAECWCQGTELARELIERVPEAQRGKACVCSACAGVTPAPRPARVFRTVR